MPASPDVAWIIDGLQARAHPATVPAADLSAYAGRYGIRTIRVENGALIFQRDGRGAMLAFKLRVRLLEHPERRLDLGRRDRQRLTGEVLYEIQTRTEQLFDLFIGRSDTRLGTHPCHQRVATSDELAFDRHIERLHLW